MQSVRSVHGVHVCACGVRVGHAQGAGGWKGRESGQRRQETVEDARLVCTVCAMRAQIARGELGMVGLSEFHNKRAHVRACIHECARACVVRGRGCPGVSM